MSLRKHYLTDLVPSDPRNFEKHVPKKEAVVQLDFDLKSQIYELFDLDAISPNAFKQHYLGNCWELTVLIGLLDKPYSIYLISAMFHFLNSGQSEFTRITNDLTEPRTLFNIEEAYKTKHFFADGKFVQTEYVTSLQNKFYNFLVYGILKGMESFLVESKKFYTTFTPYKMDIVHIANGYHTKYFIFYLFKNIATRIDSAEFLLNTSDSYEKFTNGEISFADLKSNYYSLYLFLCFLEKFVLNLDMFITHVGFKQDFRCLDILNLKPINFFTNHSYYLKSYNKSASYLTLIDPHNPSKQLHIDLKVFLNYVLDFAYVELEQTLSLRPQNSLIRNLPICVNEVKASKYSIDTIKKVDEFVLNYTPGMVISTSVAVFQIVMHGEDVRLLDLSTHEFLPMVKGSEFINSGVFDSESQNFLSVFQNDYQPISTKFHYLPGMLLCNENLFNLAIYNGYLIIASPLDAYIYYPKSEFVYSGESIVRSIPVDVGIDLVSFRVFNQISVFDFYVYQKSNELQNFIFRINQIDYYLPVNFFEINRFFDLESMQFVAFNKFLHSDKQGLLLSLNPVGYDVRSLIITANNVVCQDFDVTKNVKLDINNFSVLDFQPLRDFRVTVDNYLKTLNLSFNYYAEYNLGCFRITTDSQDTSLINFSLNGCDRLIEKSLFFRGFFLDFNEFPTSDLVMYYPFNNLNPGVYMKLSFDSWDNLILTLNFLNMTTQLI